MPELNKPAKPKCDANGGAKTEKKARRDANLDHKPLTAKQEHFAREVAKGATNSDAYRIAYSADNMKQATIARRAHEVMSHGKVSAMVDALRVEARSSAVADLQELLESNTALFRAAMEVKERLHRSGKATVFDRDPETVIAASKELSRLQGFDKLNLNLNHGGGVMCVPFMTNQPVEAWSRDADLMIEGEVAE